MTVQTNELFLEVNSLNIFVQKNKILEDVSFFVPKACLCAVVGPNGAGKSTLLHGILKIIKCDQSCITINNGERISLSYVPQTENIDWDFPATVFDIVLMGRYYVNGSFSKIDERSKQITLEKIELLGLSELKDKQINSLSGGQKQRVLLARSLAQEAEGIFLDEPFKGIDFETELSMLKILKNEVSKGRTVIIINHNFDTVLNHFDWVILLKKKIISFGKTENVLTPENIGKAFANT